MHVFGRFLQSTREAFRTGAKCTQVIKSIDAGFVAIAPFETQRIISDRGNLQPFDA
jgi:hypothetical protein